MVTRDLSEPVAQSDEKGRSAVAEIPHEAVT